MVDEGLDYHLYHDHRLACAWWAENQIRQRAVLSAQRVGHGLELLRIQLWLQRDKRLCGRE